MDKQGAQFAIHVFNSLFTGFHKTKISVTVFIKSEKMLENFGGDANARFPPSWLRA